MVPTLTWLAEPQSALQRHRAVSHPAQTQLGHGRAVTQLRKARQMDEQGSGNVSAQHLSKYLLIQAGVLPLCWCTSSWASSESVVGLGVLICSWFILEQSVPALRQEINGCPGRNEKLEKSAPVVTYYCWI